MNIRAFGNVVGLFGIMGLSVGCGAAPEEGVEDIGSIEAAWAVGACSTVTANATFNNKIDPAHVSPTTYNNCVKSYVVDVTNLSAAYTGPGAGGGQDANISASWGDTIPNNQAACEDLEGGAIFYKRINNQWVAQTGQVYSTGQWVSGPLLSFCVPPGASFFDIEAGASYRVAATMRQLSGSNPTRKVRIRTNPRVIIH